MLQAARQARGESDRDLPCLRGDDGFDGCRGGRHTFAATGNIFAFRCAMFFARACRIIFGEASYEAAGDFVRALPLSEKELFAGKILTGSLLAFCLFLFLGITQIGIARDFESSSFNWRTITMCSPLILLTLMLLSLCAAALYSIAMALTYQRGEENHTVSMVTWAVVIVLVLPFLVLPLPLLVPVYHTSVGAALKPLLLITLVLAVLTPLLVRGAYRTFDWGTAEYRGSHRGGPKAARTSILPQSKHLRRCTRGFCGNAAQAVCCSNASGHCCWSSALLCRSCLRI